MIDLAHETLVPIRDVPRLLPCRPNGKHLHISAVYRWIQRGVRGVTLESICMGGTTLTSREALQRFGERLANPMLGAAMHTPPATRARELNRVSRLVRNELGLPESERRASAAE